MKLENIRFQNNRNKTEMQGKENNNFLQRVNVKLPENRISINQVFSSNIFSLLHFHFLLSSHKYLLCYGF